MTKFFKKIFFIALKLCLLSLLYGLLCKWIMPPITLTQISELVKDNGLQRDYVSWDKISPHVKWACIASENQLFATHNGFDWDAIKESLSTGINGRQKGSAASTISQQTAKNIFLWQGSGILKYLRKIPEFFYTFYIEIIWSKRRILEIYLNTAEMGKGIFGIEAAAKHYYNKSAATLSKKEAATIIASLPNPKVFTVKPLHNRTKWKSQWILKQYSQIKDDKQIRSIIYGNTIKEN